MERRRKKRFARRLQVHYWLQGDDQERSSYTTNVSINGAFIATSAPAPPGSRLRIEFSGENGFMIEAIVSHAARVSTSLQSIRASGMGVRFLSAAELVSAMLPPGRADGTELIEEPEPVDTNVAGAAKAAGSSDPSARAATSGAPVYTVGFRNVGYVLNAIEEEIRYGGVFVRTETPARLQQDVRLALALPAPIKRTVYADAIVVTVSDPSATSGESTLRGMGVALKDTEGVMDELNKLIDAARPTPPAGDSEG